MATTRQSSHKAKENLVYKAKELFRELPCCDVNIPLVYGQFNNSLSTSLTPRKYFDSFPSLYDLDLFSINLSPSRAIGPDQNIVKNHVRCRYFTPNSFYHEKCNLGHDSLRKASFSVFYNSICSLRRNLENLQTHILDELVALVCTLEMTMIILLSKKLPRYHTRLFGLKVLFLKRKIYFVVFCIGNITTRIALSISMTN